MELKKEERSLGALFSDLSGEMSQLIRQEIQMAKIEMSEKTSHLVRSIAMIVVAGSLAYAAILALLAAAIIVIGHAIAFWLSALIIGIATGFVAGVLGIRGRNKLKQTRMIPQRTVETLKEDIEWTKKQTK